MKRINLLNALVLLMILSSISAYAQNEKERKFSLCLNPGNIGVKADQKQLLQMAIKYGYESIIVMPDQLVEFTEDEMKKFNKERIKNNIAWGSGVIPVQFRNDEATFQKGLADLPKFARALQAAGATRMNTWIMPTHPTLSYTANMKQHADRLRMCAKVLGEYRISLGLEYVGPKTLMAAQRYPFIRTMGECLELIANIGEPNVGLVLDSFHWYCAEDSAQDILNLTPKDIITVDLNDARSDLTRDLQIDGTRELPTATGVIDLEAFLKALVTIGYDGPVRTEPFNQPIRDMEDEKALEFNMESLKKAMGLLN